MMSTPLDTVHVHDITEDSLVREQAPHGGEYKLTISVQNGPLSQFTVH